MTLSSSLNAGVAGLSAHASQLATISDNIANSSTPGYKRAVTDFHSMVIDGSAGVYTAGGVRTTSQRLVDERGAILSTSNPTDLAVQGRGFLPVTSEVYVGLDGSDYPMSLVTTGSFRLDEDGYLTSPGGLVLMGWPAEADGTISNYARDTSNALEPVQINPAQFAAAPTTEMGLAVNLPATSTEAGSGALPEEISIEYFDNLGKSQSVTITFTPTIPATGESNTWTMEITDSAAAGATIGEYTLVFEDSPTAGGTLASVTPVSGGAYDPVTGQISLALNGTTVALDIGTLNSFSGMSQLSDVFAPNSITKNGSPPGVLTTVEVDANGYVHAYFDTGLSQVIYQIPLVDVPNPNGLKINDDQSYAISADSGDFFLWDAGDGPTGEVVGYAQEQSRTDVAHELTTLIQTQRAYSSNAKVIQTVDEMLQETTNIKR